VSRCLHGQDIRSIRTGPLCVRCLKFTRGCATVAKTCVGQLFRRSAGNGLFSPNGVQRRAAPGGISSANNNLSARATVLTGPRQIEIREFPIPQIKDDEILLDIEGCDICGTDVHEYKRDPFKLIPVVLGHDHISLPAARKIVAKYAQPSPTDGEASSSSSRRYSASLQHPFLNNFNHPQTNQPLHEISSDRIHRRHHQRSDP
jgi:Alcohol dehydrogenase GroES-like domain